MTAGVAAGLIGKLPAHGDFVRRGPAAAVAFLDDWLAGALAQLPAAERRALLEGLPLTRFVAVDRDAGTMAGALCASHDRSGRLYPLVVFVCLPREHPSPIGWADVIGGVLAGVAPDVTADALLDAVTAASPADADAAPPPAAGSIWWQGIFAAANAATLRAMPTAAELTDLQATEAA